MFFHPLKKIKNVSDSLWDYDRVGDANSGGIYHEGGHDTARGHIDIETRARTPKSHSNHQPWGRSFAFWKREVVDYMADACEVWLGAYRVDGLRFDSANDSACWFQTLTLRKRG